VERGEERFRVLIVDDETINIDVLVGLLGSHSITLVAKSGEQALKRLEREPLPDLILLDVVMPGLDGYEVCRRIKDDPRTKDIPVIFITGKGDERDEAQGFQVGAVDYITKPVNPVIGLARVNTHLELKRRGDILERLAGLDGLTGIANRRRFDEYCEAEWNRCRRHGHPMSLVMIDIDFFKPYNDRYGHAEGDRVLKSVAGALSRATPRPGDLATRYGGEEFACVLPETDLNGARHVADRILRGVHDLAIPHTASEAADHVTVSLGIACDVPRLDGDPGALIRAADQALYKAKEQGRNRVVCAAGGQY